MQQLARFLQFVGLLVVPMALFYYVSQKDAVSEARLMFGELFLLALGALLFYMGHALQRR